MNNYLDQLFFFFSGAMLLLMILGLSVAVIMPGRDRGSKNFFIAFFAVLVVGVGVVFVDVIIYRAPPQPLATVITFLEYLFISVLTPMLAAYLLHCCGEDWRRSRFFHQVIGLWVVFFLLLLAAQFTDRFYYFGENNVYFLGPWHPLLIAPVVLTAPISLSALFRRRRKLSRKYYHAFLVYMVPMAISMTVQMFAYAPLFTDFSIALCAFWMYGIILSDQVERYFLQQREIARQRASILVLQMRPHFIYNTMTSIYYLCDQDPKKAQQVTMDFTTYLRKNLNAIASETPIPFAEELEHTRAYLAVEQAQYDDRLFVHYDTPHTGFRIPPLTLQPIVENAVKHGMDPDAEPLRVAIRTRQTDTGSEIAVEDNGPGFDPAETIKPDSTLKNIQQRLDMMCGGSMTIDSVRGGGTLVTITIPAHSLPEPEAQGL